MRSFLGFQLLTHENKSTEGKCLTKNSAGIGRVTRDMVHWSGTDALISKELTMAKNVAARRQFALSTTCLAASGSSPSPKAFFDRHPIPPRIASAISAISACAA
jgi:hypothetical protein